MGCKQSALSMFEQGDGTKLNDAVVERLAKKFGVDINETAAEREGSSPPAVVQIGSQSSAVGFCPNPKCPTNRLYKVGGRDCLALRRNGKVLHNVERRARTFEFEILLIDEESSARRL